jgi:hypothetical protein
MEEPRPAQFRSTSHSSRHFDIPHLIISRLPAVSPLFNAWNAFFGWFSPIFEKVASVLYTALPVTRYELCLFAIWVYVLLISSWNGLAANRRLDVTFQNFTGTNGFNKSFNQWTITYGPFSRYTQRLVVYGQFFRAELALTTLKNQLPTPIMMNVSGFRTLEGNLVPFEEPSVTLEEFGMGISATDKFILFKELDSQFTQIQIDLNFSGNLAFFDNFQIGYVSHNDVYVSTQYWYRMWYIIYALVLGLVYSRDNPMGQLAAIAIVLAYGPTTIATRYFQCESVYVLDFFMQDLLSLFILNFWIRSQGEPRGFLRFLWFFGNIILLWYLVSDCVMRGGQEWNDPVGFVLGQSTDADWVMWGLSVARFFAFYMIYVFRIQRPPYTPVDLGTYTCFCAIFAHMFDELVLRLRVVPSLSMAKPFRQYLELAAIFFITRQIAVDTWDLDPQQAKDGAEMTYLVDDDSDSDDDEEEDGEGGPVRRRK